MTLRMRQLLFSMIDTTSPSQRVILTVQTTGAIIHNNICRSPISTIFVEGDYETDNFSITISWEESGGVVDEYRIQTTQSNISTTTTTVVLEGEYNVPLEIRVSAINCAGSSVEVTEQVIVGMC